DRDRKLVVQCAKRPRLDKQVEITSAGEYPLFGEVALPETPILWDQLHYEFHKSLEFNVLHLRGEHIRSVLPRHLEHLRAGVIEERLASPLRAQLFDVIVLPQVFPAQHLVPSNHDISSDELSG